jgi:hypothetical protein
MKPLLAAPPPPTSPCIFLLVPSGCHHINFWFQEIDIIATPKQILGLGGSHWIFVSLRAFC